jgi:hypothetical protein
MPPSASYNSPPTREGTLLPGLNLGTAQPRSAGRRTAVRSKSWLSATLEPTDDPMNTLGPAIQICVAEKQLLAIRPLRSVYIPMDVWTDHLFHTNHTPRFPPKPNTNLAFALGLVPTYKLQQCSKLCRARRFWRSGLSNAGPSSSSLSAVTGQPVTRSTAR